MKPMRSKESLKDNRSKGGPPWIYPQIQQEVKWRDGDIVISVECKVHCRRTKSGRGGLVRSLAP